MIIKIEQYIALFYIYSFMGWAMETIQISIREKKFVNRGFLIGPYCPIYGCGVILITILLHKYHDDLSATFFLSILICGTLEYLTSFVMEKIFKARWWDYSQRKFNINGRICLETLIPFGIAGTVITIWINPFFIKYLNVIPSIIINIILSIISIFFIIDVVVSFKIIFNLKEISKEFKDNTNEISDKVKKIVRKKMALYRRLVRAFPRIKENVLYERWEDIKKKIEESKEEIRIKIDNSKAEIREKIDDSKENFEKLYKRKK